MNLSHGSQESSIGAPPSILFTFPSSTTNTLAFRRFRESLSLWVNGYLSRPNAKLTRVLDDPSFGTRP